MAQSLGGRPGMTGTLTVRYRSPTPLHTELRFVAGGRRVDGRKIYTDGRAVQRRGVCAEAEGSSSRSTSRSSRRCALEVDRDETNADTSSSRLVAMRRASPGPMPRLPAARSWAPFSDDRGEGLVVEDRVSGVFATRVASCHSFSARKSGSCPSRLPERAASSVSPRGPRSEARWCVSGDPWRIASHSSSMDASKGEGERFICRVPRCVAPPT